MLNVLFNYKIFIHMHNFITLIETIANKQKTRSIFNRDSCKRELTIGKILIFVQRDTKIVQIVIY